MCHFATRHARPEKYRRIDADPRFRRAAGRNEQVPSQAACSPGMVVLPAVSRSRPGGGHWFCRFASNCLLIPCSAVRVAPSAERCCRRPRDQSDATAFLSAELSQAGATRTTRPGPQDLTDLCAFGRFGWLLVGPMAERTAPHPHLPRPPGNSQAQPTHHPPNVCLIPFLDRSKHSRHRIRGILSLLFLFWSSRGSLVSSWQSASSFGPGHLLHCCSPRPRTPGLHTPHPLSASPLCGAAALAGLASGHPDGRP